jgi:hypothetical protein
MPTYKVGATDGPKNVIQRLWLNFGRHTSIPNCVAGFVAQASRRQVFGVAGIAKPAGETPALQNQETKFH